jgi:hypothetical protein
VARVLITGQTPPPVQTQLILTNRITPGSALVNSQLLIEEGRATDIKYHECILKGVNVFIAVHWLREGARNEFSGV